MSTQDIPTSTDWRALCAELLQAIDDLPWEYDWKGNPVGPLAEIDDVPFERARAALAQPEPVALTDEEINVWHDQCADLTRLGEVDHYWAFDLRHDEVAGVVRAALAHWGQLTRGTH